MYIKPHLGKKKLNKLQVRDVQGWVNKIPTICQCCAQGKDARRPAGKRKCCAVGRCCHSRPSTRTISDIRNCLRSALSQAIAEELISKNPAALVKLPSGRKKKRKAWTSEQARQFLESARNDGDPLYAAYVMILVLALRKGELLGIADEDVLWGRAELNIGFQLQRRRRQLVRKETKTEASDSVLPVPAIVLTALELRKERKTAARLRAGDAWQGSNLVFTTQLGTPIEPRNFNRFWYARIKKAGVSKITPHDGRRTCATLLADLDVHPRVAMAILRHAQIAVTMEIYTQASSKATREALKKLSESLEAERDDDEAN